MYLAPIDYCCAAPARWEAVIGQNPGILTTMALVDYQFGSSMLDKITKQHSQKTLSPPCSSYLLNCNNNQCSSLSGDQGSTV